MADAELAKILIVEDEPFLRLTLGDHLRDRGFEIIEAENGQQGLELFRLHSPDLVTLDLRMSPVSGQEVLEAIRDIDRNIPVIIISGHGQMHDAVLALRAGAFDYLQKPIIDMAILDHSINRALEHSSLRRCNANLSSSFLADTVQHPQNFAHIITANQKMYDIFRYCEAIAKSSESVLITGETGVGKELLAKALHNASGRSGPFVAINVAGLDDHAFSDTLFGHVRGAFTGADRLREGAMEKAAGGTLFLDEVGDLSQQAQLRLLRVLQEREYLPLGSDVFRPLKARILTATNKSVQELRSGDSFRKDFFYRVAVHTITIPPLRERKEDIALLLQHFLTEVCNALSLAVPTYSRKLLVQLKGYGFPGNVRELKALVQDALGRSQGGALGIDAFPVVMHGCDSVQVQGHNPFEGLPELPSIRAATDGLIHEALARSGGVQKKAAAMLGISPQALCERLKKSSS